MTTNVTLEDVLDTAWQDMTRQQRKSQDERAFQRRADFVWCALRDEYIASMRRAILSRVPAKRLETKAFDVYAWACHKWGYPFLLWEPMENAEFTAHLIATLRYLYQDYRNKPLPIPPAPSDEDLTTYIAEHADPILVKSSQEQNANAAPRAMQLALL